MGDVDEAEFHYSLISLAEQHRSSTRDSRVVLNHRDSETSKGASRGHKMIENKTKQPL